MTRFSLNFSLRIKRGRIYWTFISLVSIQDSGAMFNIEIEFGIVNLSFGTFLPSFFYPLQRANAVDWCAVVHLPWVVEKGDVECGVVGVVGTEVAVGVPGGVLFLLALSISTAEIFFVDPTLEGVFCTNIILKS